MNEFINKRSEGGREGEMDGWTKEGKNEKIVMLLAEKSGRKAILVAVKELKGLVLVDYYYKSEIIIK